MGRFVTEVSMDETDTPQTPIDMLVILAALADEGIPAQTVAPKFSGRFNKGVDYVGNVSQFAREFGEDLAVIQFAVEQFGLPGDLKLSVHSGSDKFSIYRPIHRTLRQFHAGVHVKTAGTTWLEELIGLALAGGDGLAIAKDIYARALSRLDELCGPYATVIAIDKTKLPDPDQVGRWDGGQFAAALRHDRRCPQYNPSFRQLLHVGYKVAAEMGPRFTEALDKYEAIIAENVTANIYERHIRPLFLAERAIDRDCDRPRALRVILSAAKEWPPKRGFFSLAGQMLRFARNAVQDDKQDGASLYKLDQAGEGSEAGAEGQQQAGLA